MHLDIFLADFSYQDILDHKFTLSRALFPLNSFLAPSYFSTTSWDDSLDPWPCAPHPRNGSWQHKLCLDLFTNKIRRRTTLELPPSSWGKSSPRIKLPIIDYLIEPVHYPIIRIRTWACPEINHKLPRLSKLCRWSFELRQVTEFPGGKEPRRHE